MTTFDCVMVFNELDMLELRLQTLHEVIDRFVIVEAGVTHSNQPKAALIGAALETERFAPYAEQIIYFFSPTLPGSNSWERERYNRWLIAKPLALAAQPGDLVIVADVDEIPSAEAVQTIPSQGARLELDFRYYSFHWRVKQGWSIGCLPYSVESDPNRIRTLDGHNVPTIDNGGWHLSYMMSPDAVVAKITAFLHHDWAERDGRVLDPVYIAERMKNGKDIWDRGLPLEYDPYPTNLPRPVQENPAKYRALGWLE